MWSILYITMTSFVAAVAPPGKAIKRGFIAFERGENLLKWYVKLYY